MVDSNWELRVWPKMTVMHVQIVKTLYIFGIVNANVSLSLVLEAVGILHLNDFNLVVMPQKP
jgi:hypothetical protein